MSDRVEVPHSDSGFLRARSWVGWLVALGLLAVGGELSAQIGGPAHDLLRSRVEANRQSFYVYRNADSGLNKGFASGFFGSAGLNGEKVSVEAACLDDPQAADGCSTDSNRIDLQRGTVLRVTFDPLAAGEFVGLNIEEPEHHDATEPSVGYDLRGATQLVFDARAPGGASVRFGLAGVTTIDFLDLTPSWTEISLRFADLGVSQQQLSSVHLLFTVLTDQAHSPSGATVLLDNIRVEPVPDAQRQALGFPTANQTFGVRPLTRESEGRVKIPPDQVIRNLTTIFESGMALQALLRDDPASEEARVLADTFHYALTHESSGLPLPTAADESRGLHSAYLDGDLAWFNDQGGTPVKRGEVRLAGFSASEELCGDSKFCLVLDGATGGNNAFAIYALLDAYQAFQDERYLNAALEIGNWIYAMLADPNPEGYGGYFLGFPDKGEDKILQRGKSIENNGDIYSAFIRLANAQASLGDGESAREWRRRANSAGDFVMSLFDQESGCFYAGTLPVNTEPGAGIEPEAAGLAKGGEVVNLFRFLDANTFTTLPLAASPRYREAIDWRRPVQCILDNFRQSVSAGGRTFHGFSIVEEPTAGPAGIAWEFTSQTVATMRFVDALYGEQRFAAEIDFYLNQIRAAQLDAPFADGRGLVASTLEDGESLPPIEQCLSTPFQCIAKRVGLAATTWAIFAESGFNPLGIPPYLPRGGVVDAASYRPGLAPGSIGSLFGLTLATGSAVATAIPLPRRLAGASLTLVDSSGARHAVELFFSSPEQINFLVPSLAASGPAELILTRVGGVEAVIGAMVDDVAPALFSANGDGQGVAAALALTVLSNEERSSEFVFDEEAPAGERTAIPIDLGTDDRQVFLILFGTGIRNGIGQISAKIGGEFVPVAGAAAHVDFRGLDQVNLGPLPKSLSGGGELGIELVVAGRQANVVTAAF